MEKEKIILLYTLWKKGLLSEKEELDFHACMQEEETKDILIEYWTTLEESVESVVSEDAMLTPERFQKIYDHIVLDSKRNKTNRWTTRRWYSVAAASLVFAIGFVGLKMWDFDQSLVTLAEKGQTYEDDVLPGGNKAILSFSDGQRLELRADQAGIVLGDDIQYQDGEKLQVGNTTAARATLTVPKGGQYQVELSDGTKVWLNSDSKLEYPLHFGSQKDRLVRLTGEAYFEVASHPSKPFLVESNQQIVHVLGTHFNVKAFAEDSRTITTLIEGSVGVYPQKTVENKDVCIKMVPNEQVTLQTNGFVKEKVNVDKYIAWKDGLFNFENESIRDVMKSLQRWYNIEVVYENEPSEEGFNGVISKDKPLSSVLKTLQFTEEVRFKIVKNIIYVTSVKTSKI